MAVFWLVGFIALVCIAGQSKPAARPPSAPPSPPHLNWLFTAHLDVLPNTAPLVPGPRGVRLNLPITGGTVHGRHGMNGTILPHSADWVLVDPVSGTGSADARWVISTPFPPIAAPPASKAPSAQQPILPPLPPPVASHYIFVYTEGPSLPNTANTKAHLRVRFETGSPAWRWLNWVCAVGILEITNPNNSTVQDVKIDVFNLAGEFGPATMQAK
ncbi:hypothetical protein NBRC10512_000099 [Rhodotorula toruloides]|uniref:RHTO0S09e06040g1_1 n=2 Tax=Rhodotorula toruloides TaxID=5286 RepID=A0A061B3S2_RHOTO|nr:outer membrane protein, beta-barrel domain containing protein [Rhodotorula toruloides NP11]EMS19942.1 outer membrane protein, beta-barrel domain containing protein [Rhodotorula toruloides NP11]KAJ8292831.1 hypothetical protein OF846_004094 [Rhodotorula toruloides]CDR44549.1 RHTO0S09e06040g1_1 [Rhodotorula toruloides]